MKPFKSEADRQHEKHLRMLVRWAQRGQPPTDQPEPRRPATGRIAKLAYSAMLRRRWSHPQSQG